MRPLNRWERNYCGSDDPEVIKAIFRKRHRTMAILFVLSMLVLGGLPMILLGPGGMSKLQYQSLGLHYLAPLAVPAILYIILRYRCPRCNAVPKSGQAFTGGVPLFPKKCANCGAPLLPDHWLAQD